VKLYDVVLFVHVLAALTLFAAFGIAQVGGAVLLAGRTIEQIRVGAGVIHVTARMFPLALTVQVASGLYLVSQGWAFTAPWVVTALAGAVVIAAAGSGVADRRFAAIRAAANRADDNSAPPELADRIADPALWAWLWALNGLALGIVWLMTVKPGWAGSIGVTVGLSLVGAAIGRARARRATAPKPY
jgi:hypothetical protein